MRYSSSLRRFSYRLLSLCVLSLSVGVSERAAAQDGGVLNLPAFGPFNGYLSQLNAAEIQNLNTSSSAELHISLIRNSGETIGERNISIPAGGAYHLIANDFVDSSGRGIADSYGLIKIESLSGSPEISASTVFYKLHSGSQTPEFAFIIPFRNPQQGTVYGMYNSINPGQGGAVANYISIANPGTSAFAGTLQLYQQDGSEGQSTRFNIAPSARLDFGAGQPLQITGTFAIIPDNQSQDFTSFSARYGAHDSATYDFGFSLATHAGSCNETLPASTMGYSTLNWLEIGNMATSSKQVTVEVRNRSGELLHSGAMLIPARGQGNFFVNEHLGERNVGSVKVLCTNGDPILAQSAFYSHAAAGSPLVSAAYVSQAIGLSAASTGDNLAIPVNTNLGDHGAANWLKVSNEGASAGNVDIQVRDLAGAVAYQTALPIAARGSFDFDVHSHVPTGFSGTVTIGSASTGVSLRGEVVRVFLDGAGEIAKVVPTPPTLVLNSVSSDSDFAGDSQSIRPYRRVLTRTEAQHMLNNAALGDNAVLQGFADSPNRAALIEALLNIPNPATIEADASAVAGTSRWDINAVQYYLLHHLRYLNPVQARMLLFWHNHFATSLAGFTGAEFPLWPKLHVDMLIRNSLGSFEDLSLGYTTDPSGSVWLSNRYNSVHSPNENYGREFLELFNLGTAHLGSGAANYTENDVVLGSTRALSGFGLFNINNIYYLGFSDYAWMRDPTRPVNIPIFEGRPYFASAPFRYETFIPHVLYNHPAAADYIAGKIFMALTHVEPNTALLNQLGNRLRDSGFDIKALVRVILNSEAMYSPESRGARIAGPAEKFIRFFRTLNIPLKKLTRLRTDGTTETNNMFDVVDNAITNSGQDLLNPPSVFGWADADFVKRAFSTAKGDSWVLPQQGFGVVRNINSVLSRLASQITWTQFGLTWQSFMPTIPSGTAPALIPGMVLTHFEKKFGIELPANKRASILYYLQNVLDTAPAIGQPLPTEGSASYRRITWDPAIVTGGNRFANIIGQKIPGLLYIFFTLTENN